jgi:hypothetical protein
MPSSLLRQKVDGLVAYLCRSRCSVRPPGVRMPRGFCLPVVNSDGMGVEAVDVLEDGSLGLSARFPDLRQISSTLMVLKKVSTVALQAICKANLPRGGGIVAAIALAAHPLPGSGCLHLRVGTPSGHVRAEPSGRHANNIGCPLPGNGLPANCERGGRCGRLSPGR